MTGAGGVDRDPALDGAAALERALRWAHQERFTGRLTASGADAVEIRLADGLVTAALTPAAPGPDSLLLKSGRVNQADWSRAVDAVGDTGRLGEALVARSLVGGGELDVTRAAALFDGMFAILLDAPVDWRAQPAGSGAEPPLPLRPGVQPEVLLAEAGRRCALLAGRWGPPGQLARTRPQVTAKAAHSSAGVIRRHREILVCANGRRTPRDIAFVLGRGVYAVMIDIGQMEKRGLVRAGEQAPAAVLPSVAPRRIKPDAAAGPTMQLPQHLPQRPPRSAAPAEGMTPYPRFDRAQADRLRWRQPDHGEPGAAPQPPLAEPGDDQTPT